jgi:hypothetical protein
MVFRRTDDLYNWNEIRNITTCSGRRQPGRFLMPPHLIVRIPFDAAKYLEGQAVLILVSFARIQPHACGHRATQRQHHGQP